MAKGAIMYSGDNDDLLVGMRDGYGVNIGGSATLPWRIRPDVYNPANHSPSTPLPSSMDPQDAQVKFDQLCYKQAALYRYAQNTDVGHCPGDARFKTANRYAYISYSGLDTLDGAMYVAGNEGPAKLRKMGSIKHPADRWIWIEENDPRSVTAAGVTIWENQGTWGINGSVDLLAVAGGNYSSCRWWDGGAAFHGKGSSLNFADGHVEYYKYKEITSYTFAVDTAVNKSSASPAIGGMGAQDKDFAYIFGKAATKYNP
jgi:prepilin-type processing-associated H-X9-DG protein